MNTPKSAADLPTKKDTETDDVAVLVKGELVSLSVTDALKLASQLLIGIEIYHGKKL